MLRMNRTRSSARLSPPRPTCSARAKRRRKPMAQHRRGHQRVQLAMLERLVEGSTKPLSASRVRASSEGCPEGMAVGVCGVRWEENRNKRTTHL